MPIARSLWCVIHRRCISHYLASISPELTDDTPPGTPVEARAALKQAEEPCRVPEELGEQIGRGGGPRRGPAAPRQVADLTMG